MDMMATTLRASPVPTPSTSTPPTPPYPVFPRLPSQPSISRNASTSSSRSTTTTSSTSSSLVAVPIRPPPIETRTAATTPATASRPSSATGSQHDAPYGSHRSINVRNGPRSRGSTMVPNSPPSIITSPTPGYAILPSSHTPDRPRTAGPSSQREYSPTTPRGPRFPTPDSANGHGPRVTISMDPMDTGADPRSSRSSRGRNGQWSTPSSPTSSMRSPRHKQRTLSVDGRNSGDTERERRQSQASAYSNASSAGPRKPSLRDFVLGEELGRGSYSTVVQATAAVNTQSPTSPKPPRQYAIKIINQAHLVAEKKVKYALIERDALIRLAMPSKDSQGKGHRRGVSSSSSAGTATRRRSTASINSAAGTVTKRDASVTGSGGRDRLNVSPETSSASNAPLSPVLKGNLAGRRPSRSADPPEMVPERAEENALDSPIDGMRSKPPSPVKEESAEEITPPNRFASRMENSPTISTAPPTPDASEKKAQRNRRQSLAPSERSVKSGKSTTAHPGVIRLHSTFNDSTSLYFVLDLAKNGELLSFIRKHGSFDIDSTRYYAAQLIDTIEFMQERGVIHRDLKPENVLLDADMRIKITDFGSAKLLGKDDSAQDDEKKRSFVGSADFVSPEVLRNEPAVLASDIWAFGCILFQLLVGKPPFRGATDYLTFQKILKLDLEYPEGLDASARKLIESLLDLDPAARPSPSQIKENPFFSSIDFSSIWQSPAPAMHTGLTRPVATLANATQDDDIWAVFDDEVSDGGFEYDDSPIESPLEIADRRNAPIFDHHAARDAVDSVDRVDGGSHESLELPKPAYMDSLRKKGRGWSSGSKSARTSSSSSNNRNALSGLLETIGLGSGPDSRAGTPATSVSGSLAAGGTPKGSNRASRTSDRSDEMRGTSHPKEAGQKWASLLLANERVMYTSPIGARPMTSGASTMLPSFLLPSVKRRQLILTDLPRLIEIKEDGEAASRVKFEALFVPQAAVTSGQPRAGSPVGGSSAIVEIAEKGSKGFAVSTPTNSVLYLADSAEIRNQWLQTLKAIQG